MSAVTFCLLICVPRYQLAQTPVSPHGAAGQQKQTPPPYLCRLVHRWLRHSGAQGGCWGASQHLRDLDIARALPNTENGGGFRPSDRSRCSLRVWSISCIGKILICFVPGRPVNSSPYYPSSGCHMATHFMLAHKAVPDGCRHLSLLLLCVSRHTN